MKDFLDLYFLHQHGVDIKQAIEWAQRKDAGVSPATLAFVLSDVTFHRIPDYVLKPVTVEALTEFFRSLARGIGAGKFSGGDEHDSRFAGNLCDADAF